MLDWPGLRTLVEAQDYAPLFVTVSGAHLYGFPSPDSDVDLRGSHLLPLRKLLGLHAPVETVERNLMHAGLEVELVSHDLGKYLRLLLKSNGYVLEQILSPLVVLGEEFLTQLRPLARSCITRHCYHHYRGFFESQLRLIEKQECKRIKSVLYAYRVLLTGTHLLQTGTVEANLPTLAERFDLRFLLELIAQKTQEKIESEKLDWEFHLQELRSLQARMEEAHATTSLPEQTDREPLNDFLLNVRLGTS